jgi:hypothetical protein
VYLPACIDLQYALQQPQKQQLVGKSSEVGKTSEDGGFVFVLLSVFITLNLPVCIDLDAHCSSLKNNS